MRNRLLLILLATMFYACYHQTYTADSGDPRLPHFTNTGQNAGGAYVNDVPWLMLCDRDDPCYPRPRLRYNELDDRTEMHLPAGILRQGLFSATSVAVTVTFYLDGDQMPQINALPEGQVIVYELDAERNKVDFSIAYPDTSHSFETTSGLGQLHIRYVQDDQFRRKIVAGTFGFVVDDNQGIYTVRSGRFDFGFPQN